MGDFNLPKIDWNVHSSDQEGEWLLETVGNNFLTQMVTVPTRENNILDLILSTENDLVRNISVESHMSNCDHNPIIGEIHTYTSLNSSSQKVYNYKKADFDKIREQLAKTKWGEVM